MGKFRMGAAQQSNVIPLEEKSYLADRVVYIDKPYEVEVIRELFIDRPVETVREVEVEKIVHVDREVIKLVEVQVDKIVEVEKIVEVIVEKQIPHYIDREKEVIKKVFKMPKWAIGMMIVEALAIIALIVK